MSRHQALQDRLSAIEAQLPVAPARQALPHRPADLRHDAADRVSPVLQQLLAEVLPGALVLDWRQDGAVHAGRMAADGLVYRFRVDATGVGYRPAWDGIGERGWSLRSDSFLQLRAPAVRMDFRRGRGSSGQKRKCTTGYGCGSSCISLQKECRITPSSAIGKGRLRRLQQLAAAGDQSAGNTASQVMASRGTAAAALQKDRTTQRVQKLLERPEIAEFLRTGKLPAGANSSTEPGTVRDMKPGEIAFDPSRFQYKLNATATTGEVGSLSGVRKWDANLSGVMSVWKDPGDGKVYVINGHNRLALANRLGAEAVTVRFLNAATATEARAIGALQNIAEGAGSPMDAAKFFRDTGIKNQQDVEARGLPLGSGQASKGLSLSKLPGDVFNAVVRGDLTVNRGAIIGGSGLDDAKQREVFKMIGSRKAITDQTLQELVEHAAASVQRTQTTMSLFGETEEAKDNLLTRAKLSASLKAKIAREKRLFSTVSKAKAASSLTEKGGNVINQEQSAKVAGEASEALGVFERLKSSAGPISTALNRAADRVEAGEAEATVRKELERDVFAAVEEELVSVGLRKRRKDTAALEARLDALRRKCQTGYSCGSACISLRKECRSQPRSAMGKERMRKLLAIAGGGAPGQRGIAPVRAQEAGKLAAGIGQQRGAKASQLRGARAQQKPAEGQTLEQEISRLQKLQKAHEESANRSGHHPGSVAREVIAGLQALNNSSDYGSKKPGKPLRWNIHGQNHEIPESRLQGLSPRQVSALIYTKVTGYKPGRGQAFGSWFVVPTDGKPQAAAPSVLTNPGRQDPGLAPKAKQQGLNAQDVTTSRQQAAFARQQQQAAKAAGDQSGAQAWRKEERTVERNRLATAMNSSKQSQSSLFGVTEYDETMPLFKEQPAGTPSTGGSLAVQSAGGAAARPTTAAPASKPGSVSETLRQTLGALRAADAKQMGMIAEQLFEAGWTLDRRTRYRGMSKDQARDKFKVEFAQKMQAQASSPEAAARSAAMRNRAGASGTVSGALKSVLEDMKAQDQRLEDLQKQTIDLRIQAEEQFGGEGGEDPSLGGGRPRRRLGGGRRRDAEALSARIDARRKKCVTGYSCGATCIPMGKQCRITPMSAISQRRLKRLMDLAGGAGAPREPGGVSPTDRRIAALNTARNEIGRSLVAGLSKQRADGQGNYIENPDASAMQRIKAAGVRVAKIDRQLNVLEGKDPEHKRWIDGDPYGLAKYSDFQSPGRKAYEQAVIAKELRGAKPGDQAVFMSGGPASGKTSLLTKQFGEAEGFAVIDPDRIKGDDPVMRIGVAMGMREAAALAHENSSRLSKEVYATARDRGLNLLMDGTGANAGKYIAQMQELRGKGYKITLLAQHVPEEVGVERARKRADRTGRFVPLHFIKHAYEVIPGNFERLARVADRATLNDGESNQVIMQYEAGTLVGGSRKRMADYRKRYGKPDPS